MGRWLSLMVLAGCTFSPHGLEAGDGAAFDLGGVDPDLAAGPDLMPPPTLQVSRTNVSAMTFDLTAEGTRDWFHDGLASATSVERKANGASVIQASADTTLRQWTTYAPGFSWSDGTPTASANTHSGSYVNGAGHGFTITLPASTDQHTAYVYFNTYNAVSSFGAQLGDGSAPPFSEMITTSGDVYPRYAIVYRAATQTTLRITWTLVTDNGSGSVDLLAITLQ